MCAVAPESSGDFPPPPAPSEKTAACQDQAGDASACDRAGNSSALEIVADELALKEALGVQVEAMPETAEQIHVVSGWKE